MYWPDVGNELLIENEDELFSVSRGSATLEANKRAMSIIQG
jgi:hypothetical protein